MITVTNSNETFFYDKDIEVTRIIIEGQLYVAVKQEDFLEMYQKEET